MRSSSINTKHESILFTEGKMWLFIALISYRKLGNIYW